MPYLQNKSALSGQTCPMRKVLIIILILAFAALVILGINAAAAGTHEILGDAGYQPFFNLQELF